MKKALTLALAFAFAMVFPMQAFAIENQNAEQEGINMMPAYLTDDMGNTVKATGRLVSVMAISEADDLQATYAFDLYTSRANNTLTVDDVDGSASATVYLTLKYVTTSNTPTLYKLTNVSGQWVIHDSAVRVTSASLTYGFAGGFPSTVSDTWTGAVSNNFSKNTGYTDYVAELGATMGAHLTVNFAMGSTRTWSFTLYNYLLGQHE